MLSVQVSENPQATDSEHPASENSHQGVRPSLGRYALFCLPLTLGLAADLITKSYMFRHFYDPDKIGAQEKHWWIEGIFGIQTSTNPGALFGFGSGHSTTFAALSVVALVGIVIWVFAFGAWRDRWLTFSLGMICGGIFGNLYDRIGLGYTPGFPPSIRTNVRDWILFNLDGVPYFNPWPNFNIADALLVTGAIMLFVHAFLYPPEDESKLEKRQEITRSDG